MKETSCEKMQRKAYSMGVRFWHLKMLVQKVDSTFWIWYKERAMGHGGMR